MDPNATEVHDCWFLAGQRSFCYVHSWQENKLRHTLGSHQTGALTWGAVNLREVFSNQYEVLTNQYEVFTNQYEVFANQYEVLANQ